MAAEKRNPPYSESEAERAGENLERLLRYLDLLPPLERQALVLRMKDGLEFEMISTVMSESIEEVKKYCAQGMRHLLNEIKKGGK